MAFRRLAYHRSWFMVVVGAIALVAIVGSSVDLTFDPIEDLVYAAALGSAVAVLMIVRGFSGAWSRRQLFVDVAAGKLKLPDGSLRDLDNLGALAIVKKVRPQNIAVSRVTVYEYYLRAENVEYYLFDSFYEAETRLRLAAIAGAVLQHRLRRILGRPAGDGSVFRGGVPALDDIHAIANERAEILAALDALSRDRDTDVRTRATEVAAALRQRP